MAKNTKVPLTIRLTPERHKLVTGLSEDTGFPVSTIFETALELFLQYMNDEALHRLQWIIKQRLEEARLIAEDARPVGPENFYGKE